MHVRLLIFLGVAGEAIYERIVDRLTSSLAVKARGMLIYFFLVFSFPIT